MREEAMGSLIPVIECPGRETPAAARYPICSPQTLYFFSGHGSPGNGRRDARAISTGRNPYMRVRTLSLHCALALVA
ncbi:hypothetical protein, partial [Variovorax beijingensis]|uniref:hypothetical protein n=1 Tax=Variovorax beijingensis TaxID=2496117 RepID=UPI003F6A015A